MLRLRELSKKGLRCLAFRTLDEVNEEDLNLEDHSDLKQDIRMELADSCYSIYGNHWEFLRDKNNNILLGWVRHKVMTCSDFKDYIKPFYKYKRVKELKFNGYTEESIINDYSNAISEAENTQGKKMNDVIKSVELKDNEFLILVAVNKYLAFGDHRMHDSATVQIFICSEE